MPDLRELYQELIIEHSKKPRNFRVIETPDRKVEGFNPLCGDHFTVFVQMDGDVVKDISFQGSGCAISKASASIMTQTLKGKNKEQAEKLFQRFHDLVTGQHGIDGDEAELGRLAVFAGVSEFPVRVKCAILAWHAMHAALQGEQQAVTTE